MSSPNKSTVDTAKNKKKSKAVWGPPRYTTHPTGTIQTCRQALNAKKALSAVMSQLKEKSGEKFLSENGPGDNNFTPDSPGDGAGNKSDNTQWLDEAISHSLTGSDGTNLKDSVTKRRSQMGLLDADSTSYDSLVKLWDNNGDIASQSYVDQAGPEWGVTFLTPNIEKLSHDQFVVVPKHVDALQDELGHSNHELSKHLKTVNMLLMNYVINLPWVFKTWIQNLLSST